MSPLFVEYEGNTHSDGDSGDVAAEGRAGGEEEDGVLHSVALAVVVVLGGGLAVHDSDGEGRDSRDRNVGGEWEVVTA